MNYHLQLITPTESLYLSRSEMNVTHAFCTTVPNPGISTFQAFIVEYFATSILILICCGVWDKRNANKHDSAPIKFGLAITAIAVPLVNDFHFGLCFLTMQLDFGINIYFYILGSIYGK